MKSSTVTFCAAILAGVLFLAVAAPSKSNSESLVKREESSSLVPAAGSTPQQTNPPAGATTDKVNQTADANTTSLNDTECRRRDNDTGDCITTYAQGTWYQSIVSNKGMLMRTMYVLIGVTVIVVLYFVVKTIRLRRRRSKSKKYGVISTPGHEMEMTPLDQEDDDEDMTVFELNGHTNK